ncbi:MmpS family transport accessory protein [Sphingobacterium kyonggiense]
MKRLATLFLALFSLTLIFSSCSKDDDNNDPDGGPKKVQYKIIGSNDVNITTIVYMEGDDYVSKTGDFGKEWTSPEVSVKQIAIITANAHGTTDNSTLKCQILVNGKVVKESGVSTGKILTTNTSY